MMHKRRLAAPQQSFLLLGPRGTGKSTWLRAGFPDAHVVDLHIKEVHECLLARPSLFTDELQALAPGRWVIIDGIHSLPDLLDDVRRFGEVKQLRFALCGDGAHSLKRAGLDLSAGAARPLVLHPFVPEELGAHFDLDAALSHGLLPLIQDAPDRDEALAGYVRHRLMEDLQAEAAARHLPGFARFLPLAALCHGHAVNASMIARDLDIPRTKVTGCLDLLEDALLCFRVHGFEARLDVREPKLPKWYWCDPGVVRALRGARGGMSPEERGTLFEGLVAQLLRAYRDYTGMCDTITYWSAERRDAEVDFVLSRGDEHVAVEVKSGAGFKDRWCSGLRAVAQLPGLRRRIIVYPEGPALRTDDGIEAMSFAALANLLAAGELWPAVRG
jgi:predicted AAA+ superfamily ATPase